MPQFSLRTMIVLMLLGAPAAAGAVSEANPPLAYAPRVATPFVFLMALVVPIVLWLLCFANKIQRGQLPLYSWFVLVAGISISLVDSSLVVVLAMLRLSFTLRDVFWLTLVVGMGVGWWVDRGQLVPYRDREQDMQETLRDADDQFRSLIAELESRGVVVDCSRGGIFMPGEKPPRWPSSFSSQTKPVGQP